MALLRAAVDEDAYGHVDCVTFLGPLQASALLGVQIIHNTETGPEHTLTLSVRRR